MSYIIVNGLHPDRNRREMKVFKGRITGPLLLFVLLKINLDCTIEKDFGKGKKLRQGDKLGKRYYNNLGKR
jgi:hypothetical protein